MEMESNHSMYFLVPLYNSQSGRNMTIIWLILVVFPPLEKYLFLNVPTLYFQIRENITKNQGNMVVFSLPTKIFLPYIYVKKWSKYAGFLAIFLHILTTAVIFNVSLIFTSTYMSKYRDNTYTFLRILYIFSPLIKIYTPLYIFQSGD